MKFFKFFIFFSMFLYICYHIFCGNRNVFNYFDKKDELERLGGEISRLTTRNQRLQHKIDNFSDEQIDLDLLDEISRDVLGTSDAKEEIILLP